MAEGAEVEKDLLKQRRNYLGAVPGCLCFWGTQNNLATGSPCSRSTSVAVSPGSSGGSRGLARWRGSPFPSLSWSLWCPDSALPTEPSERAPAPGRGGRGRGRTLVWREPEQGRAPRGTRRPVSVHSLSLAVV